MDRLNRFRIKIEGYYAEHSRDLPWRKSPPIPYEVWLSEIILQQTRVAQGTPYFHKILEALPTIADLAEADEDFLLSLWTGLGYYSRARNLQKGAKYVVEHHGGQLPSTYEELLKIPGIGPYTAAAIASICFDAKKGVVDGNVYRVLARYFGIGTPTNSTAGIEEFQILADEIIADSPHPSNYNQGIMEFGALLCTPKKPQCMRCPLSEDCEALSNNKVAELPVKIKKGKRSVEHIHYAVIEEDQKLALIKRPSDGIWGGLYEFPRLENAPENGRIAADPIVHKLSHKDLHCHFWTSNQNAVKEPLSLYNEAEWTKLGMPIIIANLVDKKAAEFRRIEEK